MSKGLEELKRMAYENACCRCQYYIDKKCTNNYECVWKTIEKELKALEIIKNKLLVGCFSEEDNYSNYVMAITMSGDETLKKNMLTEQEYNLLSEVLVCH